MSAKLVSIRPTASSKIQLEFTDFVERNSQNVLSLLNASDERFKVQKEQRVWVGAEVSDAKRQFPQIAKYVDEVVNTGEKVEFAPVELTVNGVPLRIQVKETHVITERQIAAILKVAKRRSSENANYLHANNLIIVSNKSLVVGMPKHTFIDHTGEDAIHNLYAVYNGETVPVTSLIMRGENEGEEALHQESGAAAIA